jgi:hypothetical protein
VTGSEPHPAPYLVSTWCYFHESKAVEGLVPRPGKREYPNLESPKYFMSLNYIHTISDGMHVCFQTIILQEYTFSVGYNIHTLLLSYFYTTFSG